MIIIIDGDNDEDDNQIKKQKVEPAGNPFESQDTTADGESQFFDPNEMESQPQLNSDEDD